jgi:hypothetical protein
MVWTFCLGYGLDSLLGTLALEKSMLPWLAISSRVCVQNYSVRQGYGARGGCAPMVG